MQESGKESSLRSLSGKAHGFSRGRMSDPRDDLIAVGSTERTNAFEGEPFTFHGYGLRVLDWHLLSAFHAVYLLDLLTVLLIHNLSQSKELLCDSKYTRFYYLLFCTKSITPCKSKIIVEIASSFV